MIGIKLILLFTSLFFPLPQGGIHSGTGGGASALCAAVVQSGLQACYDSGSGLTCTSGCSNGNSVTQWSDQSGNANNLTCSGTCPIYEGAQINSNPSLRFNGSSQYMSFGTAINNQTASTIFVVFKSASTGADGALVTGSTAGSVDYVYGHSGSMQVVYIGSLQGNGNAASDTAWHQANLLYGSAQCSFRLNESADNTSPFTCASASHNETSVGYYATYTNAYFNGDIACIAIYNSALSSPNIATNEAALNTKYGI